ncbi:MepB family protein [Pseudomonas chlororaphis]|uniref:MepB family protein n=1 Tax=Pseudomonas chlororaphis TaxID=587753 RepID=UPI0009C0BF8F|nr:MepB family protein [Pseudomonas chlororaphis]
MKSDLADGDTPCANASAATPDPVPKALITAIDEVYTRAGLQLTSPARREPESAEYGATRLALDGHTVAFRVAKTTPTKMGQFVTLWKRPLPGGPIAPLDFHDNISFVVVSVSDAPHHGQFVFDRKILAAKGIMAINGAGGKRAFRVYPPWVKPVAKDAVRTQQWQRRYFLALEPDASADCVQVRRLFAV